jgi:hypothetical protein
VFCSECEVVDDEDEPMCFDTQVDENEAVPDDPGFIEDSCIVPIVPLNTLHTVCGYYIIILYCDYSYSYYSTFF